jgi:LmbE family N-acetylglucosaminyl deacetylase
VPAATFHTGPLALLVTALLGLVMQARAGESLGGLPPIDATTSLLVVAPHPDDETLCCAGAMQRVLAAGGHVSVVWITSGDGSEISMVITEKNLLDSRERVRDLGDKRMREAREATSLLGVPGAQQFFLGYPDGEILQLLTDDRSRLHRAMLTMETHVPYSDALFPGHPYTGKSLEQDFEAVLNRVHPTLVLAPSPEDAHPDHRASGLLAIRILTRRGELSKAHYWIVHGGEGWPSPRMYMPSIPLTVPPVGQGLSWSTFALTDAEESRKRKALETYHTQMEVMGPFLETFVRTSELYSSTPTPALHH